jgi:hypothetical protein
LAAVKIEGVEGPLVVVPDARMLRVLIARAGWAKGPRLGMFICQWLLAAHYMEQRRPGTEEVIAWWDGTPSERTVYRRLAELRAALPELGADFTPSDGWRLKWKGAEPSVDFSPALEAVFA